MSQAIVRTVKGDVSPEVLGQVNAHDHLFLIPSRGGAPFQDIDLGIEEVRPAREAGCTTIVDMTPLGLGRNIEGMRRISETLDMHVVAATGLLRTVSYPDDSPYRQKSIDELADEFVNDLNTDCGVIKLGADYHHLNEWSQAAFTAAAIAHNRTGAPIGIHTEKGTYLLEIIEFFEKRGVRPESIALHHVDRNPDAVMLSEVAASGVFLEFDGPSRAKYWPDSTIIELIAGIGARGYLSQIIMGGDNGQRGYHKMYGGGPGLDYLFRVFRPRVERELSKAVTQAIFVDNPARALAYVPKAD